MISKKQIICGVPDGADGLVIADLAQKAGSAGIVVVARDDGRMNQLSDFLAFFAPHIDVLEFPAWDCVPYDRVSPGTDVLSRRIDCLSRLASCQIEQPWILLTCVSALAQRVPLRDVMAKSALQARAGQGLNVTQLISFLDRNGYTRAETVMEPGEYAVRGGIVDLFPPGEGEPVRLDMFGDELESIRTFDPMTQRTTGSLTQFSLVPVSEAFLDPDSIQRFRTSYRELFGGVSGADPLYESISAGVRFSGMEHWLPLFHDGLDTLFAYAPDAVMVLDSQIDESLAARHTLILEYYQARQSIDATGLTESGMVYHPIPPPYLYLDETEWNRHLATRSVFQLSPFAALESGDGRDMAIRKGRDFADIRALQGGNVFDALKAEVDHHIGQKRKVVIATWSAGSRDRLCHVLADHGLTAITPVANWADVQSQPSGVVSMAVLALDHGFVDQHHAIVTEQDLLGDRLARPAKKKKRGSQFIAEASTLAEGDLVVHVEHGIGRYDGLETVQVSGAPHDCLRVVYDGNAKLFVPVENIDVLTRYGSDQGSVQLDRLGGTAWQQRKAKLKKRILDMAEQLIAVAAQRQVRKGDSLVPPEGAWDEFCARFPYVETDDQIRAIEDTISDLASGRPMDRLICGDVGFGKTEVALRAAFVTAMAGMQVAVVVPTTLLARQHYRNFINRFAGLPVRIEQLSRLVTAKQASQTKAGLADGSVDIVVGTHAVVAKAMTFKRLGLLIIDEEQHFGVAHKERLKQIKADVHVLTLTATPIPRTLQLALTGVREMSVIATPPVDRQAVRTFILPFDPVVIREAVLRERYRGGQVFYVCPRLADIDRVADRLEKLIPEVKLAIAHGRLTPTELEEVMTAFGDKRYDVLLSTNIIESGLDMPSVNTLIIHRADMFGLGQLYQLRGRVGRGKTRGYAYLTLPSDRVLSKQAEKRLQVMQALDTLGAGFQLASHDLDIRGAGNLLGEEQSGHIREVGIELYQQMIEEAVAAAKGDDSLTGQDVWAPQIAVGTPVLIPEIYILDLSVRLSIYRRIAALTQQDEIDDLREELVDRFGPVPAELDNLLEIIALKALCRLAGIEKIDAGPKGAVIGLRNNTFANPAGLVQYIASQLGTAKLRPDHKIVFMRAWDDPKQRIKALGKLIKKLAEIAVAA